MTDMQPSSEPRFVAAPDATRRCRTAAAAPAGCCCRPCRWASGTTSAATPRSERQRAIVRRRLRPGHHPLRPGQQLRPAARLGRGELRPDPAVGSAALPRRAGHLHQGRLRHVARTVRRLGLAQVPAGQPGPEPAPAGPRLRGHLLLPPPRPGDAAGRDDGRARHRGPPGQGALRRHLQLPARGDATGGRHPSRTWARRC